MDTRYELMVRTRLEEYISEREAMIAANRDRQRKGEVDAYGEDAFFKNASDFAFLNAEVTRNG